MYPSYERVPQFAIDREDSYVIKGTPPQRKERTSPIPLLKPGNPNLFEIYGYSLSFLLLWRLNNLLAFPESEHLKTRDMQELLGKPDMLSPHSEQELPTDPYSRIAT